MAFETGQVVDSLLWAEVRPVVAQRSDHRAELLERPRGLLLDHLQGLERPVRSGDSDDPAGLGLHRDGRDVVGHGVVQLAGQLCPLAGSPGLDLFDAQLNRVAHGDADRAGEQHHEGAAEHVAELVAGDDRQRDRDRHDEQADPDVAPRRPPGQRVREYEHEGGGVQAVPLHAADNRGDLDHAHRPERDRDNQERPDAAPRQQERQAGRRRQRDGGPYEPVVGERLDRRGNDHDEDEQPVAPCGPGGILNAWLRPGPTARLQRHADRVRDPGTRADRPKVRSAGQPTGGRRSDRTPDARTVADR